MLAIDQVSCLFVGSMQACASLASFCKWVGGMGGVWQHAKDMQKKVLLTRMRGTEQEVPLLSICKQ
jgi:hypothetical protein